MLGCHFDADPSKRSGNFSLNLFTCTIYPLPCGHVSNHKQHFHNYAVCMSTKEICNPFHHLAGWSFLQELKTVTHINPIQHNASDIYTFLLLVIFATGFGCGTLFLATDSEDDSFSSSPCFQQSPTVSPNLGPNIHTNDNCWFQEAVSQAPSTPTNAWPPDAACAARDGHVAVVPTQLFLHEPRDLKVHQKTAGDTGLQRYATDTPSDVIKCVQYPTDTPTSHNHPLIRNEEGANAPVKEVPLDSTDGQLVPTVEESLLSTSSYNSGSSTDGEPAPALKNSQDVMCNGNFLTVTTGMVTGVDLRLSASACTTASPCHPRSDRMTPDNMPGTPPDSSHRAPPDSSHRAPPDNSHRAPPDNSHRAPPDNSPITAPDNLPRTAPENSPKPTADISPKPVPGHVSSVIPIERQVSSEGEAVLNLFVHRQQMLRLQLPEIAVHDTTHSTVGGKNSDEEEEVRWDACELG